MQTVVGRHAEQKLLYCGQPLVSTDTLGRCDQATLDMYVFMFESPDDGFRQHAQRTMLTMLRPMPPCAFLGPLDVSQRDAVDAFGRLLLRRVEAECNEGARITPDCLPLAIEFAVVRGSLRCAHFRWNWSKHLRRATRRGVVLDLSPLCFRCAGALPLISVLPIHPVRSVCVGVSDGLDVCAPQVFTDAGDAAVDALPFMCRVRSSVSAGGGVRGARGK